MKVLAACEESQAVCKAFRAKGHEAYSCDIQECSGGHPEWHIQANVLEILNPQHQCISGDDWIGFKFRTQDGVMHCIDGNWDMIIAFPPCTKTTNAGAKHLFRGHKLNLQRYYEGLCGKALFLAIMAADCEKIVIENPRPSKIFDYPKETQCVNLYWFGDPRQKATLLWEKGVQPLVPSNMVEPLCNCHEAGTWFMKGGKERQKNRSKLSENFAMAMAEQWG